MYKYKTITNLAIKKLYFGSNELKWLAIFKFLGGFIFIIVLSLLFILPLHSSFLSIQHRKKMLRKEIKRKIIAGLKEEELVKLKFANADLNRKLKWKHSKEFEFNGEMYDIVSVSKTSDSTEYLLWWDAEESVLNQKLMASTQSSCIGQYTPNEIKNGEMHKPDYLGNVVLLKNVTVTLFHQDIL
jgi:hypothetical protein